jgi:hypothetical protein
MENYHFEHFIAECMKVPFQMLDTGCSGHFLKIDSSCTNLQPTSSGISVKLPNKAQIRAAHTCLADIPSLPLSARIAHKYDKLAHALISFDLLCDHGCRAIFDSTTVIIWYQNTIILNGQHDPLTKVWTIPFHQPNTPNPQMPTTRHQALSAYHTTNQVNLITFLRAACGSPMPSTWTKAIDNSHFATWPGLTSNLVRKQLPKSMATSKGHLNQHQKNVRSTQPKMFSANTTSDNQPRADQPNK